MNIIQAYVLFRKRSLNGVESEPALVVAPIKVNFGKLILIDFAVGPFPIIISKVKSSNAGYKISSTCKYSLLSSLDIIVSCNYSHYI